MKDVHTRAALAAITVIGCAFEPSTSRFGRGYAGTYGAGGTPPATTGTGGIGANGIGANGAANGVGAGGFVNPIGILPDVGAPCEPSRTVDSNGPSLLVKEPEVLARFGLERVLRQIIDTAEGAAPTTTPTELLQRLFDSENDAAAGAFPDAAHCTPSPAATGSQSPQCPRAEGKLARSVGFFTKDDPDSFVPVALVNRFDLTPSNVTTCGEYRIVYAKQSGFTDPTKRLFLIFEAALGNGGGSLAGCRPVAELWAGLEAASPSDQAIILEGFFFGTTDGRLGPVIHARNFGDQRGPCSYAGACGQIRVGQGMQEPWEFRQFRAQWLPTQPVRFQPVSLTASVRPELFDSAEGSVFRSTYLLNGQLGNLAPSVLPRVLLTDSGPYESAISDLTGSAKPDYAARLNGTDAGRQYLSSIQSGLAARQPPECAISDPLTADHVIQRITALSCAGCHSPETLLSPGRSVGCGKVWPKSLGQTHISEHGELSEALTDVFLPYRAGVLQTYLQACDAKAITANLIPSPSTFRVECFVAGTPITMADGSTKPIERVETGDLVLSFDETTHALVPASVRRTVVRRSADHLVSINGELVATDNHPFRTARGFIRAGALRVGDTLVRARDLGPGAAARFGTEHGEVRSLAMEPGTVDTYNLDVAETHGYFAGGYLVHDRP